MNEKQSCGKCFNLGKYPNCWLTNAESFFKINKVPCEKFEYDELKEDISELEKKLYYFVEAAK